MIRRLHTTTGLFLILLVIVVQPAIALQINVNSWSFDQQSEIEILTQFSLGGNVTRTNFDENSSPDNTSASVGFNVKTRDAFGDDQWGAFQRRFTTTFTVSNVRPGDQVDLKGILGQNSILTASTDPDQDGHAFASGYAQVFFQPPGTGNDPNARVKVAEVGGAKLDKNAPARTGGDDLTLLDNWVGLVDTFNIQQFNFAQAGGEGPDDQLRGTFKQNTDANTSQTVTNLTATDTFDIVGSGEGSYVVESFLTLGAGIEEGLFDFAQADFRGEGFEVQLAAAPIPVEPLIARLEAAYGLSFGPNANIREITPTTTPTLSDTRFVRTGGELSARLVGKETAAHTAHFGWGDQSRGTPSAIFSSDPQILDVGRTQGTYSSTFSTANSPNLDLTGAFVPFSNDPGSGSFDFLLQPFGGGTVNPGGTFLPPTTEGEDLSLLIRGQVLGSRPRFNPGAFDRLRTFEIIGSGGGFSNEIGNLVLAWEDTSLSIPFSDFNDFAFEIRGAEPIPEPSTYLLFAVGILGIIGMGYRRRKKAA